ncbi:unnamed protein product [Rhizoctonia solani]|uniref:MYND-type domain-containing protein n=1 Tax=Rhizoctonia solani TaxID=456999 RepID=A0A8H3AQV3_9AGAM|nr:unnamed protein product [Rhizoctonia solani]
MSILPPHHSVYGPTLDAYLTSRLAGVGVSRYQTGAPSESEIRHAILTLDEPKKASCSTFETILAMERSPQCTLLHLLPESDIGVFPACIRLLRSYCNEGRSLFDYAYGFLCLQVISLSAEVAKLALVDELWIVEQGTVQVAEYWDPPVLINNYSRKWEAREFCKDEEYFQPANKLLGWYTNPNTRLETCLSSIGGCTSKDIEFIIEQLWLDRKRFLKMARRSSTLFPWWCGLFHLMHNTLVRSWGTSTDKFGTPGERNRWIHLLELAHRYSLCADQYEDATLAYLLKDCPQFAEMTYETTATDTDDSSQMVAAYLEKMKRLPILKWAYISRLYGYVCANFHLDGPRYEENLVLITSATLEEAWGEMLKAHEMNFIQWKIFVDTVINNSVTLPMTQRQPSRAPLYLSVLTNDNLFELLGRLVLFPLSPGGKLIREEPNRKWEAHPQEILSLMGQLVTNRLAAPNYRPDMRLVIAWNKTHQSLQYSKYMSTNTGGRNQMYSTDWDSVWKNVGEALGITRRLNAAIRCGYSRCAISDTPALYQCARCNAKRYCSHRCQQADWMDTSNGHRSVCTGSLTMLALTGQASFP